MFSAIVDHLLSTFLFDKLCQRQSNANGTLTEAMPIVPAGYHFQLSVLSRCLGKVLYLRKPQDRTFRCLVRFHGRETRPERIRKLSGTPTSASRNFQLNLVCPIIFSHYR
jgi:hypothetical protein